MRLAKFLTAVAVASLATAPVVANPAAKLSVAKSDRVATQSTEASDQLGGGGIIVALLAAAAVIAGIIIVADGSDDADSN